MGTVFRAFDSETGGDVALKALREVGSTALYNLKEEFRSLRDIAHPNLVELYELVAGDEACFFTMELIEGTGFLHYVRGSAAPDTLDAEALSRLASAAAQLKRGVSVLHAVGKLHRDIKPANIMVTGDGRVVLLDFGLATTWSASPAVTDHRELAGTLPYMPPEQIWGKPLFPSADWYSVGVLLYEALTGRLPFPESPNEMLSCKERLDIRPPRELVPSVPEPLDDLVMGLLDPNPGNRATGEDLTRAFAVVERSAVALPVALPVEESGSFVGRSTELVELRTTLAELRPGRPTLMRIAGMSGIGKTQLVGEFLKSLRMPPGDAATPLVLAARCHPQEAVPFNAFDGIVDQISQHLAVLPVEQALAIKPRHASSLVRLFPVLGRVSGWEGGIGESDVGEPWLLRRQGFLALRELVDAIAVERPLIVWIDDLQWGDSDSGVLLGELLEPAQAGRILFVVSYRAEDAEQNAVSDCLGVVRKIPPPISRDLTCGPLAPDDARRLAARLLGTDGADNPDDQIDVILSEASGSPFFIGEFARHPRGVAQSPARAGGAALVADAIRGRIDQLPTIERRIVEIIAVAGGPLNRGVVLRAAGVGERGRIEVSRLCRRRLARSTELEHGPAVETYHDRIRESIIGSMGEHNLAARHRDIAVALAASPGADPEALFRHWSGAGERERAAAYAVEAADRAAAALAFGQAAELYGRAAALHSERVKQDALLVCQADALVNAGCSAHAAPLYLRASEGTSGPEAADLGRRAAEHFLVSGHIDEGVAVLKKLLASVDVKFPATPRAALLSMVMRMATFSIRGVEFRERAQDEISPRDLLRVDMCASAAKGLLVIDFLRGAHFAFLGLARALGAGEIGRVGQMFTLIGGCVLVPSGGRMARWGWRLLDRARAIAERRGDPRLRGLVSVVVGQAFIFDGKWREALRACDEGLQGLQERCQGVAWETNIGHMNVIRAVEELGMLAEYEQRCRRLLEHAKASGDVYAEVTGQLYHALASLIGDDVATARAETEAGVKVWTQSGFNTQHLYTARIQALTDVYAGQPEVAWARVEKVWAPLERSGLLRVPIVRIDAHALRARTALALARARQTDEAALLPLCRRYRRELSKEKRPDTSGHALLLEAGEATDRPVAETVALLDEAIAHYESVGMTLWASYARHRKGELLPGPPGESLRQEAQAVMRAEQIKVPERWLDVVAPMMWAGAPRPGAG